MANITLTYKGLTGQLYEITIDDGQTFTQLKAAIATNEGLSADYYSNVSVEGAPSNSSLLTPNATLASAGLTTGSVKLICASPSTGTKEEKQLRRFGIVEEKLAADGDTTAPFYRARHNFNVAAMKKRYVGNTVVINAEATGDYWSSTPAPGGGGAPAPSLYGDDLAFEVSAVPADTMQISLYYDSAITPDFEVDWGNGEVQTMADAYATYDTSVRFRNVSAVSAGTVVRIKSASKVCQKVSWPFSSHGAYVTACKQLGDIGYTSLEKMFNYSNLTTFEAGTTDTSNVTSVKEMFYNRDTLVTADLTGMDFSSVTNAYRMFYDCDALTTVTGLANTNWPVCTTFEQFMQSCNVLETIDISGANLGNLAASTNFVSMFSNNRNLLSFDMSGATFGPGSMYNFLYYAGYDVGPTNSTTFDFSNSNVDQVTNMAQFMYFARYATGSIDLTSWNTSNVTTFYNAFGYVAYMWYDSNPGSTYDEANSPYWTGLNTLQTGSATNMQGMFGGMHDNNRNWDFSGWNISSCTNFQNIFSGTLVETLNLSNWTFATGSDLSLMFSGSSNLNSLNISGWNTTGVTSMRQLFSGLHYAPITAYWAAQGGLDVSHFDVSNVTNFYGMFYELDVTSINITGWNTSSATNMARMFYRLDQLTSLDVSGFNTASVTSMSEMFSGLNSVTSLDVSGFNTANVTNMFNMFYDCQSITTLDVSGFNTANVTNMSGMFNGMYDVTSLDVSGFNTANVRTMANMFNNCRTIPSLNLSSFNTANVTVMQNMFYNVDTITSLNLSSFNTSSVTNMSGMFRYSEGLTGTLDLSGFDTSNVTNMSYMFSSCGPTNGSLVVNTTGWDTSSVTNMSGMFYFSDVGGVTGIDAWNTSSVTNVLQMFYFANLFTSPIDISGWDVTNVNNEYNFASFANILDTTNYDALLVAWEADVSAVVGYSNGGGWNFGNVQYTTGSAADTARSNLINNHGWTIQDGGGT